jgi:UDP-N-acetylmuramate--alanine ligase
VLRSEGAKVYIGHCKDALEGATAVAYSTDVKEENIELAHAKEKGLPLFHRAELLDLLMQDTQPLLVTGTHGKTTTTALLVSVLEEAGLKPSFVIGGIHQQWNTNASSGTGPYFIAEADESDGSFLKTSAYGAIVTNLENDHLDYWQTEEKLDAAFLQFIEQTQVHLFWCGDDPRLRQRVQRGIAYGFGKNNALRITSWEPTETGLHFSVFWQGNVYQEIELRLFGRHNALNGAAVFGLALQLGIEESLIRKAFANFAGTARRFEWKGSAQGIDVYDDYGHHPTEIAATIAALRKRVRERRLIVLFQPHRYTRIRDLFDAFYSCFREADLVVVTDIYSAGEAPIEGVSSEIFYAKMHEQLGPKCVFYPRIGLEQKVSCLLYPHDVVLTLGAGDVTKVAGPLLQRISEKPPKYKVAVLFGGTSSEHEVSLMSAATIIEGLDRTYYDVSLFGLTKKGEWVCGPDALETLKAKVPDTSDLMASLSQLLSCDVAIPVFHGPQGEDGMIQGFLDTLNIAYVGADYRTSALCTHKGWTKQVAIFTGIPTTPYFEIDRLEYQQRPERLPEQIEERFHYPVWMKPVHFGSSIGIVRVETREAAIQAAKMIFALDTSMIVEKEIIGREIEYSLLGNEYLQIAPACEIVKEEIFHTYDKKYGPGASPFLIPAPLSEIQSQIGKTLAIAMYRKTGCQGLARIDFFLDREGHFWFSEINPFPGFTPTSATPIAWAASGMPIAKLCDELIISAFHAHRRLSEIRGK